MRPRRAQPHTTAASDRAALVNERNQTLHEASACRRWPQGGANRPTQALAHARAAHLPWTAAILVWAAFRVRRGATRRRSRLESPPHVHFAGRVRSPRSSRPCGSCAPGAAAGHAAHDSDLSGRRSSTPGRCRASAASASWPACSPARWPWWLQDLRANVAGLAAADLRHAVLRGRPGRGLHQAHQPAAAAVLHRGVRWPGGLGCCNR